MTKWYINHESLHPQPTGKYDLFRNGIAELIGTTCEHARNAIFQYGHPNDWYTESMTPDWPGCTVRELWLQQYAMQATFEERIDHTTATDLIKAGPDTIAAFFGVDFVK